MATKKPTTVKATKVTKNSKVDEKPEARAAGYKVKKQFAGGVRQAFCEAIPSGIATLEVLAKRAGVELRKAKACASWLTANGYLTRE